MVGERGFENAASNALNAPLDPRPALSGKATKDGRSRYRAWWRSSHDEMEEKGLGSQTKAEGATAI